MPDRVHIVAIVISDAPQDEIRIAVEAIEHGLRVAILKDVAGGRGYAVYGNSDRPDFAESLRGALSGSYPGTIVHDGGDGYDMTPPPG